MLDFLTQMRMPQVEANRARPCHLPSRWWLPCNQSAQGWEIKPTGNFVILHKVWVDIDDECEETNALIEIDQKAMRLLFSASEPVSDVSREINIITSLSNASAVIKSLRNASGIMIRLSCILQNCLI